MTQPRIAIVGAGPAGCTLALVLHEAGIPSIIFEGEVSANARNQGGTLDLHDGTGLLAIKRTGLQEKFGKVARYDGEAMILANKHFRRYVNMGGGKDGSFSGRPEIDRAALRQLLVDALPEGTLRWGYKLRRVDDSVQDDLKLHFDNGKVVSGFDLVVGADGAWSKIRPLVSHVKPFYSGVTAVRYSITDASKRHPTLHRMVNRGSLFASSDGKCIIAQQLGDGSINVGTMRNAPETYLKDLPFDPTDLEASKRHTLSEFADWDSELRALIAAADTDAPWSAPLYSLPPGNRWQHRHGVTVIGDAAHAMLPFAGEGANISMHDGVKLADAIVSARRRGGEKNKVSFDADVLSKAVKAFESDMFVRAALYTRMSFENMGSLFNESIDDGVERFILNSASDSVPSLLVPVLSIVVNSYFRFFRWWYPGLGKTHPTVV